MTYGLHLALNQILALFGMLFLNALRYIFFWLMSSAVRSFTKIYKKSFKISFFKWSAEHKYTCAISKQMKKYESG